MKWILPHNYNNQALTGLGKQKTPLAARMTLSVASNPAATIVYNLLNLAVPFETHHYKECLLLQRH